MRHKCKYRTDDQSVDLIRLSNKTTVLDSVCEGTTPGPETTDLTVLHYNLWKKMRQFPRFTLNDKSKPSKSLTFWWKIRLALCFVRPVYYQGPKSSEAGSNFI